ncbi:methyltransferase isoform X2 [Carex rostrata]
MNHAFQIQVRVMRTASVRFSFPVLLHRRIVPRGVVGARSLSSQPKVNQSRGGLPRFHSPSLPSSEGDVVRIQGDEFWHMTRVLRLSINDRVELFDGSGCLVEGTIQRIEKNGSDIMAVKDPIIVAPYGMQWHVFAAFGTLKGGRADWLIEKCQRLHQMAVNSPMDITDLLPIVSQSKPSFIAVAEATPLFNILSNSTVKESGVLIVGPEGDFTEEELKMMKAAGATAVGLGACRLRVETATIALLSTLMLWSDAKTP